MSYYHCEKWTFSTGCYGDNEFLEDGSAMTAEAAAVGELATYLYGFAHGYAGVFKWDLEDSNRRSFMATMKFAREHFEEKRPNDIFQEPKYGMYFPDGTGSARPKPIVHALKFFSEYVAGRPVAGTLNIYPSKNQIGTGFIYRGDGVFFAGDSACNEKELAFTVDPVHPAIVMVRREKNGVLLMAASDVSVKVIPSAFGIKSAGAWRASGKYASFDGNTCAVSLLKGERVLVEP